VVAPPDLGSVTFRDGGADGMRLVRPLVAGLPDHLSNQGWALAYLEGPGDLRQPFCAGPLAEAAAGRLAVEVALLTSVPAAVAIAQIRQSDLRQHRQAPRAPSVRRLFEATGARRYYQMLARFRSGSGLTILDAIPRR